MSKLKIEKDSIWIRPSALDTFVGCPRKWFLEHLGGVEAPSNFRAAVGTAIHKGAEQLWQDAQTHSKEIASVQEAIDAAIDEFEHMDKDGRIEYKTGQGLVKGIKETKEGVEAFYEDIFHFEDTPTKVEYQLTVKVENNPLIDSIKGTIDYLTLDTIADIKTSTRKISPFRHNLQQSTYKWLAQNNNFPIEKTKIHAVVLNKNPYAEILNYETQFSPAETVINTLLKTCELAANEVAPLEVLFRGNPKYNFCSEDWCWHYYDCPYTADMSPF